MKKTTFFLLLLSFTLIGCQQSRQTTQTPAPQQPAPESAKPFSSNFEETFQSPPEVRSENGVLQLNLTAEEKEITIGYQKINARVYNGLYTPPLLRVRPGDTIKLHYTNNIKEDSNIHYHGFNVSPLANSDNIFNHIKPGESFDYEINIPKTHPPGLYWYHPHSHGNSEELVMSGMSGGMIVEGLLDPFPKELQNIKDRTLLLKDVQMQEASEAEKFEDQEINENSVGDETDTDIDSNAGTTRTVNGQVNPIMKISPGETQLWRIGNVGADSTLR